MDKQSFIRHCREHAQSRQGDDYISGQLTRFFAVYSTVMDLVDEGDTIFSVGAGAGYIETALASSGDFHVVVADFPEAIETHQSLYQEFGITAVGCDLTESTPIDQELKADVIVSSEVVEHLDEPASIHMRKLSNYLGDGGVLYLTTPNLARIRVIALLLLGETYLPDPDDFFSSVRFENEGVHRREYVMDELQDAVRESGLTLLDSGYLFKRTHAARDWRLWLLYPVERLIPRFRPIQYVLAQQ